MPHLLDHLVPAFGGDAYGAALDALPLGVWLRSTLMPMSFDSTGILSSAPVLQPVGSIYDARLGRRRKATPDDFRYRVVLRDGRRRVERANVQISNKGEPVLSVGVDMFSREGSNLLPKVQYAAFSNSVSVDTKQDWKTKAAGLDFSGLFDREIKIAAVGITAVGGYLLYRRFRRKE